MQLGLLISQKDFFLIMPVRDGFPDYLRYPYGISRLFNSSFGGKGDFNETLRVIPNSGIQ